MQRDYYYLREPKLWGGRGDHVSRRRREDEKEGLGADAAASGERKTGSRAWHRAVVAGRVRDETKGCRVLPSFALR